MRYTARDSKIDCSDEAKASEIGAIVQSRGFGSSQKPIFESRAVYVLLFLFHLIVFPLFAQHHLSVCAIFKNEAPFLKEWIEFHKIQGVEHFFLYNNNSEDAFETVLAPYIANREITLVQWPFIYTQGTGSEWMEIQRAAYINAIEQWGPSSVWMAFIDIDEFLFCPTGESLPSFLSRYQEYGGVFVNWLVFGTSYIEELSEDDSLIERLTMCTLPNHGLSYRIKSIVRPDRVIGCCHAHFFQYQHPFFAVNCDYAPMASEDKLNGPFISHDKIRINHYWTRTERIFREQKIPSRGQRRTRHTEEFLRKKAVDLNETTDCAIQQFVPELKKRLVTRGGEGGEVFLLDVEVRKHQAKQPLPQ
jgi:hypothetical protein